MVREETSKPAPSRPRRTSSPAQAPAKVPRRPPSKRKRTPRNPSLLEMIKEEEVVTATKDEFDPPKKLQKAKIDATDSKRRRLERSAARFTERAREKTTVAWHKSCRNVSLRTTFVSQSPKQLRASNLLSAS